MIRLWYHRLMAHHTHASDLALYRYHCFTCKKKWKRQ